MNILAIGDVVSNPGLEMLERHLRPLKKLKDAQFVIVNGENASGMGLTPEQASRIYDAGADVITLGNHAWNRREILRVIDDDRYLLRPANLAPQQPGRGYEIYDAPQGKRLCVVNLIGRCTLEWNADSPFYTVNRIFKEIEGKADAVIIDFHAEATSEKLALAYHLDGRALALFGTHTHVQTADNRVLPKGLGYITDLGMTGPLESVLGVRPEQSVSFFLGNLPERYEPAPGPRQLCGAVFELDFERRVCVSVERISITD